MKNRLLLQCASKKKLLEIIELLERQNDEMYHAGFEAIEKLWASYDAILEGVINGLKTTNEG